MQPARRGSLLLAAEPGAQPARRGSLLIAPHLSANADVGPRCGHGQLNRGSVNARLGLPASSQCSSLSATIQGHGWEERSSQRHEAFRRAQAIADTGVHEEEAEEAFRRAQNEKAAERRAERARAAYAKAQAEAEALRAAQEAEDNRAQSRQRGLALWKGWKETWAPYWLWCVAGFWAKAAVTYQAPVPWR